MHNIYEILENYYLRENYYLENNNLKKNTFRYKANFTKFKNNRDDQLSKFILDAKLLANLTAEEDLSIKNPRLRNKCPQYHYLEEKDLIAYIGYRTKVRNNEVPLNPQFSFLVIYLMEIINDLYTSDINEKIQLIKNAESLTKLTKRFRELFKEAYEILFMQNPNEMTLDNFRKNYNVPIIFEDYSFNNNIFNKYKFIYENSISEIDINEIDKFLIEQSFEEIIKESIERNMTFSFYGTDRVLEQALELTHDKSQASINKIYAYFPLYKNYVFFNDKGEMLILKHGILEKKIKPNYNRYTIGLFFKLLRDAFRSLLIEDSQNQINKISDSYFSRKTNIDYPEVREMMKDIVLKWINKNGYCKKAYRKTIKQLEYEKNKISFNIDLEDINSVRTDSAKIQNKIIIEEDIKAQNIEDEIEDPKSYFNKIKEAKREKNEYKEEDISNNIYVDFLKSLEADEKIIFNFLLQGLIEEAEIVASNAGMMLSLVIEKINIKAVEYLEDIVIENNEIIDDYREEFLIYKNKG